MNVGYMARFAPTSNLCLSSDQGVLCTTRLRQGRVSALRREPHLGSTRAIGCVWCVVGMLILLNLAGVKSSVSELPTDCARCRVVADGISWKGSVGRRGYPPWLCVATRVPAVVTVFDATVWCFRGPKMMCKPRSRGAGRSPVPAPTHAFGRRRWPLVARQHASS